MGCGVKGGPDPNCKGATEKIDATDRPQREIADWSGMSAGGTKGEC